MINRTMSSRGDFQDKHSFPEKAFAAITFIILSGAMLPLLQYKEVNIVDSSVSNPLMVSIFFGIFVITLFLWFSYRQPVLKTIVNSKLLFALVALAFLSAAWSSVPLITMRRSLALLGTTIFGVYIGLRFSLDEQVRLLAWALGICAFSSLLVCLLIPSYGIETEVYGYAWRGVLGHKNQLGRIMVVSTLAFLLVSANGLRGQLTKWTMVALSILLVLLSRSVASLLVLILLVTLLPAFMAFQWDKSLRNSFLLLVLILALGAMWWLSYYFGIFMNSIGRDDSMTGRTGLWKAVFSVILERPLLGYGYSAFWSGFGGKDAYILKVAGWLPGSAHSGFLDIFLELGVAGAAIFGIHYVLSLRRAMHGITKVRTGAAIWPLAYLACMTLTNIVESPILRQYTLSWVLYVSIATSLWFSNDRLTPSTINYSARPG